MDRRPRLVAGLLLALFAIQAALSAGLDSVTFDETAHLASGYAALDRTDFRMNPEHPALPKMICAFPLWLAEAREGVYETSAWRSGQEWRFGYEFLNQRPASGGWSARARLVWGRFPMILLGVGLGAAVFGWSRELWGNSGALASVFLYALSPTLLAHGHLVTTDLPAALGFALCLWCFSEYCIRPGWWSGARAALSLGIALLMKFSMILLLPLLPVVLLVWVLAPGQPPLERRRRALYAAAVVAGGAIISTICVWAVYGFRYAASSEPGFAMYWPGVELESGLVAAVLKQARKLELLPEAYLYGLSFVFKNSHRVAFLNGELLTQGSFLYLPEAFLLKSTPSTLLLAGLGIWVWYRDPADPMPRTWVLLPAVAYFAASIAFGMTLGHRHLSPLYPLLFIAAGAGVVGTNSGRWRLMLAALFLGHLISSATAFPRPLAYFNLAAGGASGGWRFLGDSNIDWGQDLRRLGHWMARANLPEIHLAYFGTGNPEGEGVRFRKVYRFMDLSPEKPTSLPGAGDILAVSVTLLQGSYVHPPEVRSLLDAVRTRLTPIAQVGDSILIYRIPGEGMGLR